MEYLCENKYAGRDVKYMPSQVITTSRAGDRDLKALDYWETRSDFEEGFIVYYEEYNACKENSGYNLHFSCNNPTDKCACLCSRR